MEERSATDVAPFVRQVGTLVRRAPITCPVTASAAEVARLLSSERVGSVIVTDATGAPLGIVTDRDLRVKLVAANRSAATTPASELMSTPLETIDADASGLDALFAMTRRSIHHLGVVQAGVLCGVVSSHDFLRFTGSHPVALRRDIDAASSLDALAETSSHVTALVRSLVDGGASAHETARIVAELNDRLVSRVLELTTERLAAAGFRPPVPYAWLLFGSEARGEQTLRTDQDNGLVYADPPEGEIDAAEKYYERFTEQAIASLVAIGLPRCPHDAMASNPRWRQPLSVWRARFLEWMTDAAPTHVLDASIYFDVRPLVPGDALAASLRSLIVTEAPRRPRLLGLLARDVVSRPVPLTVFGNLRRGAIDVKGGGCLQMVGAARLLALQSGVAATGTVDRLRAVAAQGVFPDAAATDASEAYGALMRLRLLHQLRQVERGEATDNRVTVEALSRAERAVLRDALQVVAAIQAHIRERFATDFVA
jgi:CBS domain-containing protein